MKTSTANLINPTRSTPRARQIAKRLIADTKTGAIRIWGSEGAFKVTTTENPSHAYTSCPFETRAMAVRHIFCRAANTGHDMRKFEALAARYYARFGM